MSIDHNPGWAKGRVWPRSDIERGPYEFYCPEDLVFQKRSAFAQLLLNGITTAAPHQQSADFWDAARLGGARALGRDDIGGLKPRARANIAVFRLDDAMMTPAIDPISTLIAGGSGKVTQARFVDGRLSMCEGV